MKTTLCLAGVFLTSFAFLAAADHAVGPRFVSIDPALTVRSVVPGDLDGDGVVTAADYQLYSDLLAENRIPAQVPAMENADLNADGIGNLLDLVKLDVLLSNHAPVATNLDPPNQSTYVVRMYSHRDFSVELTDAGGDDMTVLIVPMGNLSVSKDYFDVPGGHGVIVFTVYFGLHTPTNELYVNVSDGHGGTLSFHWDIEITL